jgi:hypothetical protein
LAADANQILTFLYELLRAEVSFRYAGVCTLWINLRRKIPRQIPVFLLMLGVIQHDIGADGDV